MTAPILRLVSGGAMLEKERPQGKTPKATEPLPAVDRDHVPPPDHDAFLELRALSFRALRNNLAQRRKKQP